MVLKHAEHSLVGSCFGEHSNWQVYKVQRIFLQLPSTWEQAHKLLLFCQTLKMSRDNSWQGCKKEHIPVQLLKHVEQSRLHV